MHGWMDGWMVAGLWMGGRCVVLVRQVKLQQLHLSSETLSTLLEAPQLIQTCTNCRKAEISPWVTQPSRKCSVSALIIPSKLYIVFMHFCVLNNVSHLDWFLRCVMDIFESWAEQTGCLDSLTSARLLCCMSSPWLPLPAGGSRTVKPQLLKNFK